MVSQVSELSRFATLQRGSLGLLKETGHLDGSPVYTMAHAGAARRRTRK
jgi:hypothetical protein